MPIVGQFSMPIDTISPPFVFPVLKRYLPLIKKAVNRIIKRYGEALGTRGDLLLMGTERLWKKTDSYDDSQNILPRGYFKNYFDQYFLKDVFGLRSTENLPGSPRWKEPYPYCDPYVWRGSGIWHYVREK